MSIALSPRKLATESNIWTTGDEEIDIQDWLNSSIVIGNEIS